MKKMMLGAAALCVLSVSANAKVRMSQEFPYVPGEVLVKMNPSMLKSFLQKKAVMSFEIKRQLKLQTGQYLLLKAQNKSTLGFIEELKTNVEVLHAEPNYIYKALDFQLNQTYGAEKLSSMSPQDPLYGKLWGLSNSGQNEPTDENGRNTNAKGVAGADISVEKAWQLTKGSRNVVVAVIDTGADYNHPDLAANMWTNKSEIVGNGIDDDKNGYIDDVHGWNAFAKNGNPMDGNGHGTHCSGTIGAVHDNGIGVAGVMSEVTIMPVKFLSDDGSGTLADAVEAIDYATKMNVDIMSNSWGGGGFSQSLFDAINAAKAKGILFVAAAGNSAGNNDSSPSYPASYQIDNVVSVASHTFNDDLSSFSCYGKRTVHVAAPGQNILSTTPNGEYKVFSGTSMATPHVSGVLGLLVSQEGRLPVLVARDRLMKTTTPVISFRRTTASGGRVNAYNLLTDTRIPRTGPSDSAWRLESLTEVFESAHPYANNTKFSKTYTFPGAKYVKVVVESYDLESGYDFIILKDARGTVVEKITGKGDHYESDYAETESVTLEFSSDNSEFRQGVVVREVKVIY